MSRDEVKVILNLFFILKEKRVRPALSGSLACRVLVIADTCRNAWVIGFWFFPSIGLSWRTYTDRGLFYATALINIQKNSIHFHFQNINSFPIPKHQKFGGWSSEGHLSQEQNMYQKFRTTGHSGL